ncbi:MAG: hypothetical protein JKY56_06675, partial [Kofleriaceae bacterium]|nr:hypothetical protein [Kofleriaceae bacterium]
MSAHQRQEYRPIQRLPCALSILTITLLTTPAMADSRQGFVLGGGTGPGFVTLGLDGARENKNGVSTDLTVGYGL